MGRKKTLFITGASSDIGNELINSVSDQYEFVFAHYNSSIGNVEKLRQKHGEKIVPVQADFGSKESIQAMLAQIRDMGVHPNHIVHLASPKFLYAQFRKTDRTDYSQNADIAIASIVDILQEFLPQMVKAKYGKVVFMLSSCVLGTPPKFLGPYVTSKYALLGMMKSLAAEYMEKGIIFNGVSPEMTETKFISGIPEVLVQQNAKRMPLGRNLRVADVVPSFEYLLSDGAEMITGQNIGITGGI